VSSTNYVMLLQNLSLPCSYSPFHRRFLSNFKSFCKVATKWRHKRHNFPASVRPFTYDPPA